MIQLSRALVRQFRTVLRKSVLANGLRSVATWVICQAGDHGLTLRSQNVDVAIEFHQDGPRPFETLILPTQALADFEGRDESLVTLETKGATSVTASWQDGVVPQVRAYDTVKLKELAPFPESPAESIAQPEGFLEALQAAAATTAHESTRYVLSRLQLRAGSGQIVATDGCQVLSQSGFSFPWDGDRLLPALPVFGCRELGHDAAHVGCAEDYVVIRLGPWRVHLHVDTEGKFPPIEEVMPDPAKAVARLHVSLEDAEFLTQTLPRLSGSEDESAPVTLECSGRFALRAKSEGQKHPTEVILSKSTVSGQAFRCHTNRTYLLRAIKLGLREFCFFDPDRPILALDAQRRYLWQILSKEGVIAADAQALRITSDPTGSGAKPSPSSPERSQSPMNTPKTPSSTNGTPHEAADAKQNGTGINSLIAEAEALKEALKAALARANDLVTAVKRQKKAAQVVQSTLQALRGLQEVEA